MKKSAYVVAAALVLAGCASSKPGFKERFELCELNSGELRGQLREGEQKSAALQAQLKDLEGQVVDLDGKLKAQSERIDSLSKSNKDLSSALTANTGELSGKLSEVVKEKDDLARQLDTLKKDKITGERIRQSLQAKRDKTLRELEALRAKHDELAAAAAAAGAAQEKARAERSGRLAKVHEDLGTLADSVLKDIQAEKASLSQDGESVVLTLQDSLLFKPQQAKLTEEGVALLDRIGRALQALGPRAVRVEGHSDNSPIKWELFGSFTSHWELSTARATAVARYLHEHSGLDPRRLTAAGFGEFRPVKGNDTPEGRNANRRLVLVVDPAGTL